ncbi:MAG: hypothetical protein ACI4E0_13300 [Blautia sp.]
MKKIVVLFMCVLLGLVGCSDGSQKSDVSETTKVSNEEVQETEITAVDNDEISEQSHVNTSDVELAEIPFGFTNGDTYTTLFTIKMPATTYFIGGTYDNEAGLVDGYKTCKELSDDMGSDGKMESAAFTDNELLGGAINISGWLLDTDFDSYAEEWIENGDTSYVGFATESRSGTEDGYKWSEMYGFKDGTMTYHLLLEMNSECVYFIDVYGAPGSIVYDWDSAHNYYINAITRK